jgi:hypothetical protein
MLSRTVTCLGNIPSAHPAFAGSRVAQAPLAVFAERVVRPHPIRRITT